MERRNGHVAVFTGYGAVAARPSTDYSWRRAAIQARLMGRAVTERGDLDAVSEAIGYLRADIRNLRKTIETAELDRKQAQEGANEHRGAIQRAVEDLRGDVEQLASDLRR
jgi:hypothetical protein